VLLGGEIVDRAMLLEFMMERVVPLLQGGNDDAQLAAAELQTDPIGLSVDGMVKGRTMPWARPSTRRSSRPTQPRSSFAIEHVTQDGTSARSAPSSIFESYDGMRRRAAAAAGRSVKVEHAKKEGILMTVRGLGAIDDTNIDAYGDAFAPASARPSPR
jgi:hypothetical protein